MPAKRTSDFTVGCFIVSIMKPSIEGTEYSAVDHFIPVFPGEFFSGGVISMQGSSPLSNGTELDK